MIARLPAIGYLLLAALLLTAASPRAQASEETVTFGRFGSVAIYRETDQPTNLVLFVSGDGGWNSGVVDMARSLASLNTMVAGIDITRYLKALEISNEQCASPAIDFEALSQFLQKKYASRTYRRPILVGYSSGATLVYGTLVQGPAGTFAGAVSLGFCPDLQLRKPLCSGAGLRSTPNPKIHGVDLLAAPGLDSPWAVMQGEIDQVCDAGRTAAFTAKIPAARYIPLPKVGHGFSVQRNWLPQFRDAFRFVAQGTQATGHDSKVIPTAIGSLPVTIVESAPGVNSDALAVMLSGDGGWAGLDKDVAKALAARGIAVIGLDSLAYFWTRRTPEEAAQAVGGLIEHYAQTWHKKRVLLIGYSFGASVAPFVVSRLPAVSRARIAGIALLAPDTAASFEFHIADWLGGSATKEALPVAPEIAQISPTPVLCLYGAQERDSICPHHDGGHVRSVSLRGGHHFNGDYKALAEQVASLLH